MCLVAIASLVRPGRSGAVANAIDDIICVVCAAGLVQYAFGWPRLPKLWWRISGPLISLILIGKGASMLGWLGTRLAIRPLTFPEQLATAGAIVALLGYVLMIVIPLLRLGQWQSRFLADPRDGVRDRLGRLEHTFS